MEQQFTKNSHGGPLSGPDGRQEEFSSLRQLNSTALKTGVMRPDNKVKANSTNNSKHLKGGPKQIFCQTTIEDQRSKLRILADNTEIEGIVDNGADVTIISPKSWPAD